MTLGDLVDQGIIWAAVSCSVVPVLDPKSADSAILHLTLVTCYDLL